ncbi:MAG: winged helix-turn-helix transcriptional regulator [Anaerolineales bacterium]|nr:winged helix-turn-helix transcriptional regulator [Anaerolineales bacterium]
MSSQIVRQKFIALSDPARLDIVRRLASGPKTAGELAGPYPVSRPAVSRHLRVLREAGIARAEVRGREWWYSVDPAALQEMQAWLEEVRGMWSTALASLKDYVEEQDG